MTWNVNDSGYRDHNGESAKRRAEPKLPRRPDGIYPRCVWCNGENYAPAVWDYSHGCIPCGSCGKTVPPDYIPFNQDVEDEMDSVENEIAGIADDRMREMTAAEFNKRYGPYLTARLNDEENP